MGNTEATVFGLVTLATGFVFGMCYRELWEMHKWWRGRDERGNKKDGADDEPEDLLR